MKQRLIQQLGRSARLKVVNELKRSQGLSVGEIAERLGMSYMGVKGVCVELEKRGLLDTWRTPHGVGRPHLAYRLTSRAHDLFPTESNALTLDLLESAQRLFGPTAPEKLLLVVFQKKAEGYVSRLRGETLAGRMESLAKLRDADGCMAEFHAEEPGARIVEHHSPILDVLRAFPLVARLEAEMFKRVLGVTIVRDEETASGLFRATFSVAV